MTWAGTERASVTPGPTPPVPEDGSEHRRLQTIYEISSLLARYDSATRTLAGVMQLVARSLPLRSAIVSAAAEGGTHTTIWQSDEKAHRLRLAKSHVRQFADYFGLVDPADGSGAPPPLEATENVARRASADGKILSLPLSLADGTVFGSVVFECLRRPTEPDIEFASMVANHLSIALDRADRVATRLALTEAHALASVRARDDLLSIVAHDLKNPLSTIMLALGSLLNRPEADERRVGGRRQLQAMQRATIRMTSLLGDLLDSASMEAGTFSVRPERADVAALVADAVAAARPFALRKSIRVDDEIQGELPEVRADVPRIQQVLANLLGNAIKFTPESGCVTVRAYPSTLHGGASVTIAVSDNGPGISELDQVRLFERFWQGQATSALGTGLGLFIAQTIVNAHGAKLWVESQIGSGSTFFFELRAFSG
jgi:signal transduction histidine kinase